MIASIIIFLWLTSIARVPQWAALFNAIMAEVFYRFDSTLQVTFTICADDATILAIVQSGDGDVAAGGVSLADLANNCSIWVCLSISHASPHATQSCLLEKCSNLHSTALNVLWNQVACTSFQWRQTECFRFAKSRARPEQPMNASLTNVIPLSCDSNVPWPGSGRGFWEVLVENECAADDHHVRGRLEPSGTYKRNTLTIALFMVLTT